MSVLKQRRSTEKQMRNKREAIEAVSKEIVPPEKAEWDTNIDLKQWLKTFNRK